MAKRPNPYLLVPGEPRKATPLPRGFDPFASPSDAMLKPAVMLKLPPIAPSEPRPPIADDIDRIVDNMLATGQVTFDPLTQAYRSRRR